MNEIDSTENISLLPNNAWKLIISFVDPSNYFNIHGVCSLIRQCLRDVYRCNPSLKENQNDVLSLLVFKQRFPVGHHDVYETIIKGLDNPNHNEKNKKYLIRALLQFDICYYDEYTARKLWNFLFKNEEFEILKHVSKMNAVFIYKKMIEIRKKRDLIKSEEEFFQHVFDCIIKYPSSQINKLALQEIEDRNIDLFLKFYNSNKLSNLIYCLIKLIKQNDYETVEYLLDRNIYNKKNYKRLWKATNTESEDMQNLILFHCNEQQSLRLKDPKK